MTVILLGRARRSAVVGALSAGLFAGITGLVGCSSEDPDAGTNGMADLSAAKIHSQARAAADSVASVTVNADLVVKGQPYKIDMKLNSDGGTGKITDNGVSFRLLRVGDDVFVQADAALLKEGDKPAEPSKLSDKYVKVPEDDPKYKRLRAYTDKGDLLDMLLDMPGKLTKGDRSKVGAVRTIQLAAGNGEGGTIDVSLEGEPYPLRLVRAGGAGTLRLSDWGQSVTVTPPDKDEMVDFGSQLPKSSG